MYVYIYTQLYCMYLHLQTLNQLHTKNIDFPMFDSTVSPVSRRQLIAKGWTVRGDASL